MLPYTPPVEVVYPAIGVDENAFEAPNLTTLEPVRYMESNL